MQARTAELAEAERAEVAARRARNTHYAAFQKHQADVKARRKERAKLDTLQEAAMLEEMANDQDERFRHYAQEYIDAYKRKGKPIKPMELTLAKKPPFESA